MGISGNLCGGMYLTRTNMEAPDKIYFTSTENGTHYYTEVMPFERESIEYVRKNAFIEKAEKFIYSALNDGLMDTTNIEDFIKLFKKYMEE